MIGSERAYLEDEAIKYQLAAADFAYVSQALLGPSGGRLSEVGFRTATEWQREAARASEWARFYLFRSLGDTAFVARAKASSSS